jgi:REP-associated tyrosine transposase
LGSNSNWKACRRNITRLFSWSMKLSKDIRHGRHCVSALHVHLVFVTKYRRKVFDRDALERLQAIFEKVCRDF